MKNIQETLRHNFFASVDAKKEFLNSSDNMVTFEKATLAVTEAYKSGGRLYIAGNGGSAADAQHLAAEFVSKLAKDRNPLPAEALTVDTSVLTAIGNDYGYDKVFSRQILGKMTPKDIFLGITTSGKSPNIIAALEACKAQGVKSIVFTGRDGGETKHLADFCVIATGSMTSTIQEVHITLAHTLCECVEHEIFFN